MLPLYTRGCLACLDALSEADEQLPSKDTPFKKVNTLHVICTKANTADKILFALTLITKLVRLGGMSSSP